MKVSSYLRKGLKNKYDLADKDYSWLDTLDFVEVCFSCNGQNISRHDQKIDDEKSFCLDCHSEDIGSVPKYEVL